MSHFGLHRQTLLLRFITKPSLFELVWENLVNMARERQNQRQHRICNTIKSPFSTIYAFHWCHILSKCFTSSASSLVSDSSSTTCSNNVSTTAEADSYDIRASVSQRMTRWWLNNIIEVFCFSMFLIYESINNSIALVDLVTTSFTQTTLSCWDHIALFQPELSTAVMDISSVGQFWRPSILISLHHKYDFDTFP